MNNRYISDILSKYEKKRAEAEHAAECRLFDIYKKIPRIKHIDEELASLGVEAAKSVFRKDIDINNLIETLRQKSIDLKMEKGELLSKNNYPTDYALPKYSCSDCQDTGYSGSERCHCFKQQIIDRYYSQSNLKKALTKENFDTFVFDYYSLGKFESEGLSPRKNMENIFSACVKFSHDFDISTENLFFYGRSGLGKTFLSNCIAKDLLDRGKLVIYQTASNLIEVLKDAKFENNDSLGEKSAADELNDIFGCHLLIIDDLGTEYYKTEFSQMELYNVINRRLLAGRKMIISTNFSLENIYEAYAERITSRIFGNFSMHKFYGDDIRVMIGQQKKKKVKK